MYDQCNTNTHITFYSRITAMVEHTAHQLTSDKAKLGALVRNMMKLEGDTARFRSLDARSCGVQRTRFATAMMGHHSNLESDVAFAASAMGLVRLRKEFNVLLDNGDFQTMEQLSNVT